MLQTALNRHEQENGSRQSLAGTALSKDQARPLSTASSQSQSLLSLNGSLQKQSSVLKPSSANTLNRRQSEEGLSGYNNSLHGTGIKRTSNGLAKIMGGSFEDQAGCTADKPILVADETNRLPKVESSEFFNADDFDSDIELDVEEPKARHPTTNYPKLPQTHTRNPFKIPTTTRAQPEKPILPTQQQRQSSTATTVTLDSGYASMASTADSRHRHQEPASSNPLPWGSSPPEHHQPIAATTGISNARSSIPESRPSESQQRPSKRRMLPWTESQSNQNEANARNFNTPIKKEKKENSFPWNTTASSIKAQQKAHREGARKSSAKEIDGTEESILAANGKRRKPGRVFLSEEQQQVLELVTEKKKSVFFTGSAGTGKSVLLREIISTLRRRHQREPDRIAVTASTGLAACNIGGVTLHSFSGIGLGKEDVPELVRKIKKNQKAKHRWMRTKVLVVDEVSMVDGELFDKLEAIARQLRNNGRPFGGIQLVITGDFFQLPPVPDNHGMGGRVARFAFDAQTWKTSVEHTIALHHVFRQKDPVFAGMLNEMREGQLSESSIKTFRSLSRPLVYGDSLDATELFPTRNEVERANQERMSRLQGELMVYEAKDGGSVADIAQRDKLLSNCLAPPMISLKKGAQVMLIKNIDETLVNGSLGRVIGFMDEQEFATYHADEEAFASTQGGTLVDEAADPEARNRQRDKLMIGSGPRSPLVRFSVADGTFRDLLCTREAWKIELPNGEVQASRSQIPLILAWALSIHKAQGQTLDRVKVDLGKVFENGQAYVALSRATSMGGLQVLRFDPKKVTAHAKVRTFYANLSKIELENKDDKKQASKRDGLTASGYEKNFVEQAR